MEASFWIHILASLLTLFRRKGRFAVTPKHGESGRQIRPVAVPLAVVAILGGVAAFGLVRDHSPGTVSTAAFALVHITVLLSGVWPALQGRAAERRRVPVAFGGEALARPEAFNRLEPLEPVR
jgi:hypothetical protein